MIVFDLKKVKHEDAGVIALGFFDCIHIGHKMVIQKAISLAHQSGVPASVFLFKNNIFPMLGVEKYPLFTFEERLRMLEELGVDRVFYIEADEKFLSEKPSEFLSWLKGTLTLIGFTCGRDFSFGAYGAGSPEDLVREIGGQFEILELCEFDGEKVSSEGVKKALSEGNLAKAERFLGRKFSLLRVVSSGRKQGEKMGFPTINAEVDRFPLKEGVYFTEVLAEGKRHAAVTNVGGHPTFGDAHANVESYLLDYSGDLYGKEIEVFFLKYRREIRTFSKVEDLVSTIEKDVQARREYE